MSVVIPGNSQPAVPVVVMNQFPPAMDPILAKMSMAWMTGQIYIEEFTYIASWQTLAANAQSQLATVPITIDPNIDLIVTQLNLTSFSAAGTIVANPDYLLQITETNGRGDWFSQPAHVSLVTGQSRNSGSSTMWMPAPRYVRGTNALNTALTNLTATAARVDMSMGGYFIKYLTTNRTALFGVPL